MCRRGRSILFICARARSMAAASASRCTLATSERRASPTSGCSRWRLGGGGGLGGGGVGGGISFPTTQAGVVGPPPGPPPRLSDRPDRVWEEIGDGVAKHYDEPARAPLVFATAGINAGNRLNVTTRQIA